MLPQGKIEVLGCIRCHRGVARILEKGGGKEMSTLWFELGHNMNELALKCAHEVYSKY